MNSENGGNRTQTYISKEARQRLRIHSLYQNKTMQYVLDELIMENIDELGRRQMTALDEDDARLVQWLAIDLDCSFPDALHAICDGMRLIFDPETPLVGPLPAPIGESIERVRNGIKPPP